MENNGSEEVTNRVAVDIGGTFVDLIEYDIDKGLKLEKTPTTPENPTKGVINALEKADVDLSVTEDFIHGTTIGLNAYIEREGSTTGVITNEGHRDILEIGRMALPRDEMYNVHYQKPDRLVPRRRRIGVPGRLNADGEIIEQIDEDAILEAADKLVQDYDVESIAVCFLHSYVSSEHEKRAAALISEKYPEIFISTSSNVAGEIREFERTSTTVLDAYIKPLFEEYIDDLKRALKQRNFDGRFFITRSGGGAMSAESAKSIPVYTILSGPVGGVTGAAKIGGEIGQENLITVDMGGTSLDTCQVREGSPVMAYESSLEDRRLLMPTYDIRTIGAGGGSIAWTEGNSIKVGPNSAGADPGPICYNQGGTEPTITDVALELGYISKNAFLGGELELDAHGAHRGIEKNLADPLNISCDEAAKGVMAVLQAKTIGALREITVEQGLDPREFALISYGGAGPMIMPSIAREMEIDLTIIPKSPAGFSASGILFADVVYDYAQTNIETIDKITWSEVKEIFQKLEEKGEQQLSNEGFPPKAREFKRSTEMRYNGQNHYVEVPADDVSNLEDLGERFEEDHLKRYDHKLKDIPEIVNFRVRCIGNVNEPKIQKFTETIESNTSYIESREAFCFAENEYVEFDIHSRENISNDERIKGPAIIREPANTIVLFTDQVAEPDQIGNIIVKQGEK